MSTPPGAEGIEQVAFGFMASKVLFSAIDLGLFTELAKRPLDANEIQARLNLHPRSVRDFLDALVAPEMLEQAGIYTQIPRRLTSTSTVPSGATSAVCTKCSTHATTISLAL